MFPELFKIPGVNFSVHSFGLMMVIGLLCGMELAKRLARRQGYDGEVFANAAILALIAGLVGARLSHVLENFGQYTNPERSAWANFKDAINITSGGLTYYGGFLLATPVLIYYAVRNKIPVLKGMDIIAPCLMVGLAFGRIGCFLNGCCYGAQCELPWAVHFPYASIAYSDQAHEGDLTPPPELIKDDPEGPRLLSADEALHNPLTRAIAQAQTSRGLHPAQLYSTATAFLLAGICLAYLTMPHLPGRVFALMMIMEGIARFLLESVRAEPAVWRNLSYSQVLGIAIAVGGVLFWLVCGHLSRRRGFEVIPATA